MKTSYLVRILSGASLLLAVVLSHGQSAKSTLGVASIAPTQSLREKVERAGKGMSLGRLTESMDHQLIDRLNATRKFDVVADSDLEELIKKQKVAQSELYDKGDKALAQTGKLAGVKYYLVTAIDDFEDYSETAVFEGTGRSATRRMIRLSAVGKIYDSTTGKLLESASFQCSNKDLMNERSYSTKDGVLSDELLVAMAREMAGRIANRVTDVIFPAKVLARRDMLITLNRGDGTGVAVDQVWDVFAAGEDLIDPDTKEVLGKEEIPVGKARITGVQPKTSTAELIEDKGVQKGAIARPVVVKPAPESQ